MCDTCNWFSAATSAREAAEALPEWQEERIATLTDIAEWAETHQHVTDAQREVVARAARDAEVAEPEGPDGDSLSEARPSSRPSPRRAPAAGPVTPTHFLCAVCRLPQRRTPSGLVCANGHGGAESALPDGPTPPVPGAIGVRAWVGEGVPVAEIAKTPERVFFGGPTYRLLVVAAYADAARLVPIATRLQRDLGGEGLGAPALSGILVVPFTRAREDALFAETRGAGRQERHAALRMRMAREFDALAVFETEEGALGAGTTAYVEAFLGEGKPVACLRGIEREGRPLLRVPVAGVALTGVDDYKTNYARVVEGEVAEAEREGGVEAREEMP